MGVWKEKNIYMINALYMNLGRVNRVGFFKAQYEKRVRCSEWLTKRARGI